MVIDVTEGGGQRRKTNRTAVERASSSLGGRTSLVEPTLLCALATRPGYGYDLKRTVEDLTDGLVALDLPATYRALRRLEEEGLVESTWARGEFGPQRREYALTPAGRALLADWRAFLTRQRRACELTTHAIDAALGAADPASSGADGSESASPEPGGGA